MSKMVNPVTSDRAIEQVRDALARPDSYPHHPGLVQVRETHISWVFLAGEFAYKLKKPLVLGFLDYGTAEKRRKMCREEVRLNRRLAPGLYLGVRGVVLTEGGAVLVGEDEPRAVEFVVEMRRYDERDTFAARLDLGELGREEVAEVGRVLARFHAGARSVPAGRAPVLTAERRFERNVHELLGDVEQRGEIERIQALEALRPRFHRFARGNVPGACARGSHSGGAWGSARGARASRCRCADR